MDATKTPTIVFTDIDFSLILYSFAALLIGGGGTYYIMKTERAITAIGFFIASLAIFIYFGLRWFDGFKLRQSLAGGVDPKTPWPPVINYCPDFMSLKQEGTNFYCVDTMGISMLTPWTEGSSVNLTGTTQNAFALNQNNTGQTYATSFLGGATSGITWEGIYDGRSASTRKPPFPASTA